MAYVGLGGNLGDRLATLRTAVGRLGASGGISVESASSVYETEALIRPESDPQPHHLNAVAGLRTGLPPLALLDLFKRLEVEAGRDLDAPPWSARPLDLDLLLYGEEVVDEPTLQVPHPELSVRRFVLVPLADVAAHQRVPGIGKTVAEILAECPDPLHVRRTTHRLTLSR
ncbi:MAG: 2-amino-4-hydroxy-6-hydroxymethyldihydropteridine diphosphokinase [Bacteroidota bacterium]